MSYKSAGIYISEDQTLKCYSKERLVYVYSLNGAATCVGRNHKSLSQWLKAKGYEPTKIKVQTDVGVRTISAIPAQYVWAYWVDQVRNNNGKALNLVLALGAGDLDTRASQALGDNIASTTDLEIQDRVAKSLDQCRDDFTAGHPNFQTFCYRNNINPAMAHDGLTKAIFGDDKFTAEYFRQNFEHNRTRNTDYGVDHYPEAWMITLVNYAKGMFCNNHANTLEERIHRASMKARTYYHNYLVHERDFEVK